MLKKSLIGFVLLASLFVGSQAFARECMSAFGNTVCGYDCKEAFGEIKCAETPDGACEVAFGEIKCWDPPRPTHVKAQCVVAFGEIYCGYNCTTSFGETTCDSYPEGYEEPRHHRHHHGR